MEAANLFVVDFFSKDELSGKFFSESPASGVDGGNVLSQKMAEATRCTIISLGVRLKCMVDQADITRSLTVRMKRSISRDMFLFGCTV